MKTTTGGDAQPTDRHWAKAQFPAAPALALPVLLAAAACERDDAPDPVNGANDETAEFANVGPDWETAAARAIVEIDGAHEKTIQTAEFLVNLIRHHLRPRSRRCGPLRGTTWRLHW